MNVETWSYSIDGLLHDGFIANRGFFGYDTDGWGFGAGLNSGGIKEGTIVGVSSEAGVVEGIGNSFRRIKVGIELLGNPKTPSGRCHSLDGLAG